MDKMGPKPGEERGRDPMSKAVMPNEEYMVSDEGILSELRCMGNFVSVVVLLSSVGYAINEIIQRYWLTK